ncbi:MAG: hypothetical protein IJR14_07280 [Synergistaceae bacterium]|nr:hypothetical protein [Synergistaceae bacterium]
MLEKIMRRAVPSCVAACLVILACWAAPAWAAEEETSAMRRWAKENDISDKEGNQRVKVRATYWSNEYVAELIASEAEKNLWTRDEVENYKYTLMKTLSLHDSIAFHISFYVEGVPMYAQPFDKHITLMIGKQKFSPSDYDKRFNFKISGPRDGMVNFPRYDPKTGKDLLEGAKDIRLILDASISQALSPRGDLLWVWDVTQDKGDALGDGLAMDRLEVDRLLRRMEKLKGERDGLQSQLDELDSELAQVDARIEELQSR